MKKTILYIIPHLQSTGPVQQLYNLVKNLDMEFFIPKILTLYHERQNSMVTSFEQLGIEVLRLNARKKDLIGCMVGIQRTINSLHPDIIHTETAVADILYYFVLFKKKVPWVTTIHNYAYEDFPMAYGKLVGLILANFSVYAEEKANARVACSKTVCEKYESNKKFSLQYIQNGVDTDTWNTINKTLIRDRVRKQYNIADDAFIIISTGALIDRKNPLFLIDNIKKCNISNAVLLILGDGPLKKKCLEHSGGLNVVFTGRVNNVKDYLLASDLFVSASKSEGLPMAVLEALACGVFCLLSDISQHIEIAEKVNDGINLYSLGDEQSFISALSLIKEQNRKSDGYNLVDFDAKVMASKYQDIYKHFECDI